MAETIASLTTLVSIETGRGDLVNKTIEAVKAAVLKAHQLDFFSRDIVETGLIFSPVSSIQQISIPAVFPRYRAIKYLRRLRTIDDKDGPFMDIITPESVMDEYNCPRTDIAYVAGNVINLRAAVEVEYMLAGYYTYPDVITGNFSSWIADDFTYAVVYEAARRIFVQRSDLEAAREMKTMVAEQYKLLVQAATADLGY